MRLAGKDLAIAAEVIEHIDLDRLDAFERSVFEFAKPGIVIVTTPNCEYNSVFENMEAGQMRHTDHRFEWTRREFQTWADRVCETYQYEAEIDGIGTVHEDLGSPTQICVFRKGLS